MSRRGVAKIFKLYIHYKSFKFQIEAKDPLSPTPPSPKKVAFYCFFPTSYMAEPGFRWVTYLLSNVCNHLDIVARNYLDFLLTTLQPDIKKLASVHQVQGTH